VGADVNGREILGVVVRAIGIYFAGNGLTDGVSGLIRVSGVYVGGSTTWQSNTVACVAYLVVGIAFLASAEDVARLLYKEGPKNGD
jgi:hypothetical protein